MPQDPNDRTQIERVDPLVGSILDRRFRIDFRLAAGGFGAIYRATHVKSKHEFALKVLHPQLSSDAGVVARFQREGQALTTLRCPNTITAYEIGEADDGTLYIVMELLRGESLYERFRAHGRFEWKRMIAIARAVCKSLEEAHALGIIHRDLKPTNIHLERVDDDSDFVKVLDFGIAKILRDSDFDSSDLTNAGQMIGTLDYMSPEQMVGGACTGKSDIYTLGILTYEMIAGKRPFDEANTAAAALAAILRGTPTPLSEMVPVPELVNRVVMKCLEREPQDRFADVIELGAALDLCLQDEVADITRTVPIELPLEAHRPTNVVDPHDMTVVGTPPQVKVATRGSQPEFSPPHARDRRDSHQALPGTVEPVGARTPRPGVESGSPVRGPHIVPRDRTPAPALARDLSGDLDSLTDPVQGIPRSPRDPSFVATVPNPAPRRERTPAPQSANASPRAREQGPNTPAPRAHRDSYQVMPGQANEPDPQTTRARRDSYQVMPGQANVPAPQTHGAQPRAHRDSYQVMPGQANVPAAQTHGGPRSHRDSYQALPGERTPGPQAVPGAVNDGRGSQPFDVSAFQAPRLPPKPTPAPLLGHRHPPTPAPPYGNVPPAGGNVPTPAPLLGHRHPPTPAPPYGNVPAGAANFPPTPAPLGAYGGNFPPTPAPAGAPYGGNFPPTPAPPGAPYGARGGAPQSYDIATAAARDAAMRRFIWLAVLVLGAIAGIVIATQL